jgi:hypothetical protein
MEVETTFEQEARTPKPLTGAITLDEFKASRVFLNLTERQQMLLETYIVNGGDKVHATLTAYDTGKNIPVLDGDTLARDKAAKQREIARILSYEMFGNPNIVDALNVFFGRSTFEILKREADRLCRKKSKTVAEVEAFRLKCQLNGISPEVLSDGLRVNGYTPKSRREVPVGCRPILKSGVEVGYLNAKGQRVNF